MGGTRHAIGWRVGFPYHLGMSPIPRRALQDSTLPPNSSASEKRHRFMFPERMAAPHHGAAWIRMLQGEVVTDHCWLSPPPYGHWMMDAPSAVLPAFTSATFPLCTAVSLKKPSPVGVMVHFWLLAPL